MIHSLQLDYILRLGLIILFIFFTAPIIAHSLAVFHLQGRNIDQEDEG
jgi:multisubunit Na+/H+ antiporter MnhG subunit